MNTEQFKYFSLVYETLSFSTTAKRVPMSLPGIIKAIKQLERSYAVTFFTQSESGALLPTKYADEFYRFTNTWEVNRLQLERTFEDIRSEERHEVRVALSQGVTGLLGPGFVSGFEKLHPEITLIYHEHSDYECDKALKQQACDFAFTMEPYDEDLVTITLFHGTIAFWINRSNPLSEKEVLTIRDLAGQNIAIPGRDYKCFNTLRTLGDGQGIELGLLFETAEIFQTFEFALNGLGLGYTNEHLKDLSVFQREGEIVCLPIEGWTWDFGISYLPSHTLTEAEQRFYDYCINFL
jgi:DNA-binding transcriptional LysR family regulator